MRKQRRVNGVESETELVQGLLQGKSAAIEALVARHGGKVYRLAQRMTGNRGDAEEVAQDALFKVIRKIGTFRGEAAFTSWVYRIVANSAYEKHRFRRWREDVSLDEMLPVLDRDGNIEDWLAARQAYQRLNEVVDLLPSFMRVVFILSEVEGCYPSEIAEWLGISVPAVKSRLHRARVFLRRELAEYIQT